jgi:4-hydroxy-tetrahydrodipicolinate synthase
MRAGDPQANIMSLQLGGSLCALATPFRADGEDPQGAIDFEAFGRLVDHQIDGGTGGLVVAGSTGEAAALDEREFGALIAFAVQRVAGRAPVLAGTGQQSTRKTIEQTRRARDAGADAALVVVPPYVRATREGLYRHFGAVADHGGLPVVLYNVPARSACDLDAATSARLAAHGNIVGIKEALADPARMEALLAFAGPRFVVLSGDDPTCARAMLAGAGGVVSVSANLAPAAMARLCAACLAGAAAEATDLDRRLQPLHAVLGRQPNPIPVKWCLARIGIGAPDLRLPLLAFDAAHHAEAESVLADLGLVEAARPLG